MAKQHLMRFYNTLTRKKEEFRPIKKGQVSFYSCGPTVYNYAHIGNLRTYIFTDVLQRVLEYNGYRVKRVMNITDVGHLTSDADTGEDKMEKGAREQKKTVWQVAQFYTKAFFQDIKKLDIEKPAKIVKATDTIKEQIKIIGRLFKKGYAYETGKAVYFDVSKFKDYGRLSGQKLSEKLVAARGEVVEDKDKHHPADFVLWFKLVGKYKNHTMRWPTPWGGGFPGWHIECSAISTKYLGQPFDIHTGGVDHIGTHHTNEIAQSQAAYGKPLARYWLHGEFLLLDKGKMAKSSGQFITLQTLIDKGFNPLAYRYLVLTAHYRSRLNFSWESMQQAQNAFKNLLESINVIPSPLWRERNPKDAPWGPSAPPRDDRARNDYRRKFTKYLNDDLNTPRALTVLYEVLRDKSLAAADKIEIIKDFDRVLGLDLITAAGRVAKASKAPAQVQELAWRRWQEKIAKNYAKADAIRLKLAKMGYVIEDQEHRFIIKKDQKIQ